MTEKEVSMEKLAAPLCYRSSIDNCHVVLGLNWRATIHKQGGGWRLDLLTAPRRAAGHKRFYSRLRDAQAAARLIYADWLRGKYADWLQE